MSKHVKHNYHHSKSRKLHEHEYHSPHQLLFNRIFVAPAIQAAPINKDPDNDGDDDSGGPSGSGNTDND